MGALVRKLLRSEAGGGGVEFALVGIIFLGMMLTIIDLSRFVFEVNAAKAATRFAARYAVVSDPAATAVNASWGASLGNGSKAPNFSLTCTSAGCSCTSGSCPNGSLDSTAFNNIVDAARRYHGRIQASNLVVVYDHVGIGVVGNPYAPDVEPLVTVRLTGLNFAPGAMQIFGVPALTLPSMATTLSGEDLN